MVSVAVSLQDQEEAARLSALDAEQLHSQCEELVELARKDRVRLGRDRVGGGTRSGWKGTGKEKVRTGQGRE